VIARTLSLTLFFCCRPLCIADTCQELKKAKLPNAEINVAEVIPQGVFKNGSDAVKVSTDFCRVGLILRPSDDSDIRAEVWLPLSAWNRKLQGVGNGGFAGSPDYASLASAVSHGYAATATDTGHQSDPSSAAWALDHPQKVVDFGYRAVHEMTVAARVVVAAFYGENPAHAYLNACSNGGRQGLMEAQRYPADFDGIAAGAPTYYWTRLLTALVFNLQALSKPGSGISAAKLPAIERAALAACDSLDGVKDGIIGNPLVCRFNPEVLLCRGPESDGCLTRPQIGALKAIYGGAKTSKGVPILPGYEAGGEAEPLGWRTWITGESNAAGLQSTFGLGFFKFMVYADPKWDYRTSRSEQNSALAEEKLAAILNATDSDLRPFERRGGKLILYHGWNDAAVPPRSTIDYYRSVARRLGPKETATFVRLFMIPGWGHCGGGTGPNIFGQSAVPMSDADHDIEAALERWVEHGIAPERVIASQMKPKTSPAEVFRTRPLCAYPLTAHWTGTGSTDSADNFLCR
jgi:feruloyl esterase